MNAWSLVYEGYEPEGEGKREALCTLGNGYFATRGAAPDARADDVHYPGTYLAGGYDRAVTEIEGHELENEDLVNLPNWLGLAFRISDDDWLHLDRVEVLSHRQELDLRRGVLLRSMRLRDAHGRTTRWEERRFVGMHDPHLAGLSVVLTAEDWSGPVTICSTLDGGVVNSGVSRYRDLESRHLDVLEAGRAGDESIVLLSRMRQSRLEVAQAVRTRAFHGHAPADDVRRATNRREDSIGEELSTEMQEGDSLRVEKILALYTLRDRAISNPMLAACEKVNEAADFDELLEAHTGMWLELWRHFDAEIDCGENDDTTLKVRLHLFHLLQTVSPHSGDLDVGIPARGWHGEAYRGHIFWDEIFVFPLLTLRMPTLARDLLLYRYRRLPAARRAARNAGYRGAMYPWQSGSSGREESQRLHLNPDSGRWIPDDTHRQRHIGSAIAYNVWTYYEITEDLEFLCSCGAEMLLEIARFWASIATYDEELDRYEIRGVMGPDEYHTALPDADPDSGGLDNNAYTNVMAAWVLTRAEDVLDILPGWRASQLRRALGIGLEEIDQWRRIARKLRVCFHGGGIVSQFEGYEKLQELDWEGLRSKHGDIQRLDRILESEGDSTNRYKVSKQADVLMLFYLFSSDELQLLFEQLGYPFDDELIPRNIEYYLDRTSHGSTLSRVAHSWVLARSNRPRSWRLLQDALDSDISDIQGGTTPEGIHLGAMAGSVDLILRGFTGIEPRSDILHFNPSLPSQLRRLSFRIRYRHHLLRVEIDSETLSIESLPLTANPIRIAYRGRLRMLSPGESCRFHLLTPRERERSTEFGEPVQSNKQRDGEAGD